MHELTTSQLLYMASAMRLAASFLQSRLADEPIFKSSYQPVINMLCECESICNAHTGEANRNERIAA